MHWRTHVQEHMDLNVSAYYITLISRMLLIFVGGVQNLNVILAHSGCFCNAHVTGSICVAVQGSHFNLISSDFLNYNTLKRWSIDATSRVFHNFCLHSFIHPPQFWPPRFYWRSGFSTDSCFNKSHFALQCTECDFRIGIFNAEPSYMSDVCYSRQKARLRSENSLPC